VTRSVVDNDVCSECGLQVVLTDGKSVSVEVNRAEVQDDVERLFRETQLFTFCGLDHANAYMAKHPIPDEWSDTEIDDGGIGPLGAIGCALMTIVFVAALITGLAVGGQWVWHLLD
jgi:hypothetical protein